LHPREDGNLTLEVTDNGAGFEDDFDWRESDSLGLHLVSTLTSHLHGTIEVSGKNGASFVLTFPG
jgi:two-component sensor histidine kinase